MFDIKIHNLINTNIPIITNNYKILHFDEFPILYCGNNNFGNKIIGSLADEGKNIFRFFHTVISNETLNQFINKEISYLDIIKNSNSTFILDKDINEKLIAVYQVTFQEIPEDYLPLSSSFCPGQKNN